MARNSLYDAPEDETDSSDPLQSLQLQKQKMLAGGNPDYQQLMDLTRKINSLKGASAPAAPISPGQEYAEPIPQDLKYAPAGSSQDVMSGLQSGANPDPETYKKIMQKLRGQ